MEMSSLRINSSSSDYPLCILSYNSRGFGSDKQEFCKYLMSSSCVGDKLPILCNQENFILKGNSYKVRQAFPGFFPLIKPAVKESYNNGRPKNGMFILVPNSFKNSIVDVSPDNWRIQAAIINLKSSRILLLNTYFPVDRRNLDGNIDEVVETIECIQDVIEKESVSQLLLLGDINADFLRNSPHCLQVKRFLIRNNLEQSWNHFAVDFTHCHQNADVVHLSTIDHFFWNENLHHKITDSLMIISNHHSTDSIIH